MRFVGGYSDHSMVFYSKIKEFFAGVGGGDALITTIYAPQMGSLALHL
jgi:hypothetical protein